MSGPLFFCVCLPLVLMVLLISPHKHIREYMKNTILTIMLNILKFIITLITYSDTKKVYFLLTGEFNKGHYWEDTHKKSVFFSSRITPPYTNGLVVHATFYECLP